ncbi:MAG: GTPase, partial [Planctomycetota bacterium]
AHNPAHKPAREPAPVTTPIAGPKVQAVFATPLAGRGAIAVISLAADDASDLDAALGRILDRAVPVGSSALRRIAETDTGVVARWTGTQCDLMPHGGPAIIRAVRAALEHIGIAVRPGTDIDVYPEARSGLEAKVLRALATAASPLAIDVLLAQPARWRSVTKPQAVDLADAAALARLLRPPTVVAAGAPSVGKSSLLNALLGHDRVLVDAQPGTTRDHIGVRVNLSGLVVNWVDTPGIRGPSHEPASKGEAAAIELARSVIASADLLLRCGDARHPPPGDDVIEPSVPPSPGPGRQTNFTVALRSDLAVAPWDADAAVSIHDEASLRTLAVKIRDALVPPSTLSDERPWKFW